MRRLALGLALAACGGGTKEPAAPVEVRQIVTLTGVSMGAETCHIAVETDVGAEAYEGALELCDDRAKEWIGGRVVLRFDGDLVVEMLPE
jgi:hypothetical protein